MKENTLHNSFNQDKINEQLSEFLNKYNTNNSTNIGKLGEDKLCGVLNKLYPSSHIENTSSKSKQGDFILKRNNLIGVACIRTLTVTLINFNTEKLFGMKAYLSISVFALASSARRIAPCTWGKV